MSLTSAHPDYPELGCTALPVDPAAKHVLLIAAGCHMGSPGRSVSSQYEAAAAARRNAAAPAGGPKAEKLDDPAHRERRRKNLSVQNCVWTIALKS